MQPTFNNGFWSFTHFKVTGLIWLKRSNRQLKSIEEIKQSFEDVVLALRPLNKPKLKILVDLRDGPSMRNDPEFEKAATPYRRAITEGFYKSAILLKSAAGTLQVKRYRREDGGDGPPIFGTQEEALLFLGFVGNPIA
jgi:hypothetical protein